MLPEVVKLEQFKIRNFTSSSTRVKSSGSSVCSPKGFNCLVFAGHKKEASQETLTFSSDTSTSLQEKLFFDPQVEINARLFFSPLHPSKG
ncbi:hypothetical protein AVEN_237226-1 [Araneus ventricosus]|uniref:Uncharacterized protein n=1 Tax=Araneus ventricosus TaxID=182803 RepID=A0A4Y2WQG7_ARAVE|nr:hypothetical protein AVEN_237226-1 [Araneus ventricosus]